MFKIIDMRLEPKDLYEKLEFDKILQLVDRECYGELGRAEVAQIKPLTDLRVIEQQLSEVSELKLTIEQKDNFPISAYASISEDLKMLEVEGFVLAEEGLKRINIILLFVRDIFKFFNPTRQKIYPVLYKVIQAVHFDENLIEAIEQVIDEEGEIRADASPELLKIRKLIVSKQKELDKVFRSIINEYRKQGWLTDNVESFRNGRRVLSVPSEHKRKIRGIIHDESTTGKTAFIEPEAVININNDIFDLETEEKREIYRILKELSALLRPYIPSLNNYQDILVHFDVIQAKARLALHMEANKPKVFNKPNFGTLRGFHPLLLLKNKKLGRETVPFDLKLIGSNRIVVLSGPNAGGKSITMKSVGLLQMMLQSGFLIPVDEESEMGVFQQLFADIGDQQSLEDDLSTYSSRLTNMRVFLENANEQSLILIDEFGSGTDPQIGGAIAESILWELNGKKVHGIITTHYSNLKIFAFKTRGIVNGSMTFDKDNLSPTYEFRVGRPGSSYAFEIAQKTGLPGKIIKYAKKRTGKNEKAVDQLLIDLQREKQEVEEKLKALQEKEQKLDKLVKNYDQMHRDLEFKRKKLRLETKEKALQNKAQNNRDFEQLVREIREEKNLEKAKKMATQVKEERKKLVDEVSELREQIYYQPKKPTKKGEIKVGDHVRMKSGGTVGTVESIDKNKAVVQMGPMRVTIHMRDLEHANAPLEIKSSKSVKTDTINQNANFENKIDIRGMRMEEALKVVEDFVDQALISNASHLRILHGKGNGTLRKVVKMKLKEYDVDMKITHPEEEQGGNGITLIEMV